MTIETILAALETRQADISIRFYRQYCISRIATDYPAIFLTLNEEGEPVGNDDTNYIVDESGDERSLTDAEERIIVSALAARDHQFNEDLPHENTL
jgi:hypothetical protein